MQPATDKLPVMGSSKKFLCMQCESAEARCACERYCCLCQSQLDVRLCQDGLYYCPACREACDYRTSE